ncbi:hypothetical protein AN219_11675 [Streptomyces nanshensis]|nr:hypothetical protein AN219_11675 [Streptomyces nanshensis]
MITLACTVVLAVALPVAAATAGAAPPADGGGVPERVTPSSQLSDAPSGHSSARSSAASSSSAPGSSSPGRRGAAAGGGASASCGPELTSPEGLSGQTCVLSEGGSTWARTYYRNGAGSPLSAALTLMRPDGSSLRADCAMTADRGTSVCETPREKTRTGGRAYAATGEAGSADGERLLLRSGSNFPAR